MVSQGCEASAGGDRTRAGFELESCRISLHPSLLMDLGPNASFSTLSSCVTSPSAWADTSAGGRSACVGIPRWGSSLSVEEDPLCSYRSTFPSVL